MSPQHIPSNQVHLTFPSAPILGQRSLTLGSCSIMKAPSPKYKYSLKTLNGPLWELKGDKLLPSLSSVVYHDACCLLMKP